MPIAGNFVSWYPAAVSGPTTVLSGLAMALVAGCAGSQVCREVYSADRPAQPFVWQVRGPNGTATLLGTFHAAGEGDVPARAWHMLDDAELFVAEADEVERGDRYRSGESWRKAMELPRGASLMKLLPASEYQELERRLSGVAIVRLKPWAALSLLIKSVHVFAHPNITQALVERARERVPASEFLDSWEQQVAFLDETVGVDDLRGALADIDHVDCSLKVQLAAYRAGDDDVFRVDRVDAGAPRVTRWADRITEYLGSGRRIFVAVGVGTILGPHGLAAALQSRGFEVTRLGAAPGSVARSVTPRAAATCMRSRLTASFHFP